MATTRIKDISSTVTSLASDDYIAVDGATNGTRKMVRGSIYTDVASAFTGAPTTYDICPLNSGTGKIDATYLPTSGDTPKGEWNANTNSPALADGSGAAGDYYDVTTAGSQDLGSGSITFTVGDVVKYNGSTWYKIDSVANFLDGYSTAATSRAALEVNSKDEDAQANALKTTAPALYFNGTSSFVTVADDAKLSFTDGTNDLPFSVSAWVKADDWTRFCVASKWGSASPNREWVLASYADQLRLFIADSSGNRIVALTNDTLTAYEGQWTHVAATYSADSQTVSDILIYINGVSQSLGNDNSGTYGGMSDSGQNVEVGRYVFDGTNYSKGHIRNVQLFNRELTADEVAQLARGNDLGFSSEWGGALGGNGTIDETVGLASWTGSGSLTNNNLTETANTTVGARANVLKLEATATGALDTRFYGTGWTSGKRVRIEFDYYLPSGNTTIDTISFIETGGTAVSITETTQDAWTRVSTEVLTNGTGTFQFRLRDGSVNNATIGDYIGLDNFRITEIGTLADFRAENFIADKLIDQSSNNFVGTNNGATLVGGRKALQLDTDGAAAGNNVLSVFNGSSHLAYVTDKGDLNANSISSGASTELTIATGAVTATKSYHTIDTESDAASDDLDTISGGRAGQMLIVQANNSARSVVLKDGTGNLKLSGDITLDNAEDTATLVSDGTSWYLIATSNNGA